MEAEHDENKDDFVSADVFLKQLNRQQPQPEAAPGNAAYKRASLALLKQQGGIRNKINLWERSGPLQPQRAVGPPSQRQAPAPGAAPRLAPVKEEREPAAPTRSGSLGGSLFSRAAAAVQAVLPSPGTKQSMAARQEAASFPSVQAEGRAASFPSILFGTKQPPKQLARAPLPKLRDSLDGSVSSGGQWRLASAQQQPAQTPPSAPEQQAEADDQLANVDAMSDSSSEWHDASEVHQDQVVLRDDDNPSVSSEATTVVPGEEADDDSTADSGAHKAPAPVVPQPEQTESPPLPDDSRPMPRRHAMVTSEVFHSAMDMLPLDGSLALAASGNFSFAQALLTSWPSSPQQEQQEEAMEGVDESGLALPAAEAKPAAEAEMVPPVEEPVASLAAGAAEALPSPAVEVRMAAGGEASFGSSAATESQGGSMPELAPAGSPVIEEQGVDAEEMPFPAGSVAGELGAGAEHAAAGLEGPRPPTEPAVVLPLFREFSEAELLYRGVISSPDLVHSSHSSHVQQQVEQVGEAASPGAASASRQQETMGEEEMVVDDTVKALMFEGAAAEPEPASSPGAPNSSAAAKPEPAFSPAAASSPTTSVLSQLPALLVSEAAQQEEVSAEHAAGIMLAEAGAAAEATAAAELASPQQEQVTEWQPPESSEADAALAQLSPLSAPEPASPYAATEYDGDDVVMDDAVLTPAPSTVNGSKLRLEALAMAGLAVARSPLPLSPSKTPPASAAAERRLYLAPAEEANAAEAEGPSVKAPEPEIPPALTEGGDVAPREVGALVEEQLAAEPGLEVQGPAEPQGPSEEVPATDVIVGEPALTGQALVAGKGSLTQDQKEEEECESAGAALEEAEYAAEEAAAEDATEQLQAEDEEGQSLQNGQEAASAAGPAVEEPAAGEGGLAQLQGQAVGQAEGAVLEAEAGVEAEEAALEVEAALEAEEAALEAADAALEAAGAALHAAEAALQSPTLCRERLYAEDREAVLEVEQGFGGLAAAGTAAAEAAGDAGLGISGLPAASAEEEPQAGEAAAHAEAALVGTGSGGEETSKQEPTAEDMTVGDDGAELSAASQEESHPAIQAELTAGAAKVEVEMELVAHQAPAEAVDEPEPEVQLSEAAMPAPESSAVVPADAEGAEPQAAAELAAEWEPVEEPAAVADSVAEPEAKVETSAAEPAVAVEPAAPLPEAALLEGAPSVGMEGAWEEAEAATAEEQQAEHGEDLGSWAAPVEAEDLVMAEQKPELPATEERSALATESHTQQAADSSFKAALLEADGLALDASCAFEGAGEQGQQHSGSADAQQSSGLQHGEEEAAVAAGGEQLMAVEEAECQVAAEASLDQGEDTVGGSVLGEEEALDTAAAAGAAADVEVRSPAPAAGKAGESTAAAAADVPAAAEGEAVELQEEEDVDMMDVDEETEVFETAPASLAAPTSLAMFPAAQQASSPVAPSSPQEAKEAEVCEAAPASPAAPTCLVKSPAVQQPASLVATSPPFESEVVEVFEATPASPTAPASPMAASSPPAAEEVSEAVHSPTAESLAAMTTEDLGTSLTHPSKPDEASAIAPTSPTASIAAALEPASSADASNLLSPAGAPQSDLEQQHALSPVCSPAAASMQASPQASTRMEDELPVSPAEAVPALAAGIEAAACKALSVEVLPGMGAQSEAEVAAGVEQSETLLLAASAAELPARAKEEVGAEGEGSNASSPAFAAPSQPSTFAAAAGDVAGSPSSPAVHLARGPLSGARSPDGLAAEAVLAGEEVWPLLADSTSSPAALASPAPAAAAAAEEQGGSPVSASSPAVPASPVAAAAAEEQGGSPVSTGAPAVPASPVAEAAAEEQASSPVSAGAPAGPASLVAEGAAEEQAGSPVSASLLAPPAFPAVWTAMGVQADKEAGSPASASGGAAALASEEAAGSPISVSGSAAALAVEEAAEETAGSPISASGSAAAPTAEEGAEEQAGSPCSTGAPYLPASPVVAAAVGAAAEDEAGSPTSASSNAAAGAPAVALGSPASLQLQQALVGSQGVEEAVGEQQAAPSPASPPASCCRAAGEPSAVVLPSSPGALRSPQRSPAQGAEVALEQGNEQEGAAVLAEDVEMMDAEPAPAEGEVPAEEAAAAVVGEASVAAEEATAVVGEASVAAEGEEGVAEQAEQGQEQEGSLPGSPGLHAGEEAAGDSPAGRPSAPGGGEGEQEAPVAGNPGLHARDDVAECSPAVAGSPGVHAGKEAGGDSPAGRPSASGWQGMAAQMNFNPLAASLSPRYMAASPAITSATGGYSNSNPLYAGTPGHPTPPSVTLKTFPSRLCEGTPLSRDGSASSPASVGIKLAERLQEVASQLQQPLGEPAPYTATPGLPLRGQPGGMQTPGGPGGSNRFAFASDVAAMLQALDQRTPATALMPGGGRAAAMATTVQRQPRGPRFSFASTTSAAVFNLDGFDVDGNRNGTVAPTPAHGLHAGPEQAPLSPMAEDSTEGVGPSAASQAELEQLRQEVAALKGKVSELEEQREEAVGMLAGYQGSIAQLQDQHSSIMVKVQAENTLLKAEIEQLKGSKAEMERQFNRLYHEKYAPLKAEAGPLRHEATTLRSQLAAEEAKGRRAEQALQALQQELAAAREELRVAKEEKAAALAAALAAQQAGQKMEQKLKAETQRSTQALTAVEAELADVSGRYSQLAKQYDEAVHKVNLAKQARERAYGEVQRKEEEICNLEVRLRELEGVLRQYKTENSKFFDMKERYKTHIVGLEKEVQAKEAEKEQLLKMCNELMTQLEREGLCLDG